MDIATGLCRFDACIWDRQLLSTSSTKRVGRGEEPTAGEAHLPSELPGPEPGHETSRLAPAGTVVPARGNGAEPAAGCRPLEPRQHSRWPARLLAALVRRLTGPAGCSTLHLQI